MTDPSRSGQAFLPAFGQADLSNCEREQIHLAGSIQPHGALLVVSEPDLVVVQASANCAAFLGCGPLVPGMTLADISEDLDARIRPILGDRLDGVPVAMRCVLGPMGIACDVLVHRPAGSGLVIELEPAGEPVDFARQVETALQRLLAPYPPACRRLRAVPHRHHGDLRMITASTRIITGGPSSDSLSWAHRQPLSGLDSADRAAPLRAQLRPRPDRSTTRRCRSSAFCR